MSRSDIASQTKVAERHLIAIEDDRFNDLAARTYAVGFSRAYARAVGLDEAEIAEQVRRQLDADADLGAGLVEPSFEPGDPARVPPVRLAWVAAAGVVVVVGVLIAFWGSFISPEGKLPDLIPDQPVAQKSAAPAPATAPSVPAIGDGPVVMTATADRVWVKVTDVSGKQLLQKELALGESWTVPQDVDGPQLRTGRPDALQLTVGGKQVPPLADRPVTMSGISLAATDLLARGSAPPAAPAGTARNPLPAPARSPAPAAIADTPAPRPTANAPVAVTSPAPPRPIATASRAPRQVSTLSATLAGESPSPRSGEARTEQASRRPAVETVATPTPSPGPRPVVQPVSTVSE